MVEFYQRSTYFHHNCHKRNRQRTRNCSHAGHLRIFRHFDTGCFRRILWNLYNLNKQTYRHVNIYNYTNYLRIIQFLIFYVNRDQQFQSSQTNKKTAVWKTNSKIGSYKNNNLLCSHTTTFSFKSWQNKKQRNHMRSIEYVTGSRRKP